MTFEWDETKNQSNITKHGVSFETAKRIFDGFTFNAVDSRTDAPVRQSLTGDRVADRDASWGAWREQYGASHPDPQGGHWHHSGDGASINQTPEF